MKRACEFIFNANLSSIRMGNRYKSNTIKQVFNRFSIIFYIHKNSKSTELRVYFLRRSFLTETLKLDTIRKADSIYSELKHALFP